jgi:general transcription factor 3C polypeptide 5 (transcription factor C subunit 1)
LAAKAQISPDRLKFIIPAVAYYFTTGPWRNLWIRFGYDPRKDRSSAKYQSLDYRVRVEGGITHKVKKK